MRYYLKKLSLFVIALDGTLENTWAADSPYPYPTMSTLRSGSSFSSTFSNMSHDVSAAFHSRDLTNLHYDFEGMIHSLATERAPSEAELDQANKIMVNYQAVLIVKIKALRSKTDPESVKERARLEALNDTTTAYLSHAIIQKGNSLSNKALMQEMHEKAQVGHEKALSTLRHRINPHVPLEIQAIIPQDILNDCNFKDDDTDLQKAQKMAKLGLVAFGATDEQLVDLAVTRPEVQFFAAMFFNKAGDHLKQHIISLPKDPSTLTIKMDYLVSTYQFYNWSCCQLERAGRLHSNVAQSVFQKRDSVAATAEKFIMPETAHLLEKIRV